MIDILTRTGGGLILKYWAAQKEKDQLRLSVNKKKISAQVSTFNTMKINEILGNLNIKISSNVLRYWKSHETAGQFRQHVKLVVISAFSLRLISPSPKTCSAGLRNLRQFQKISEIPDNFDINVHCCSFINL